MALTPYEMRVSDVQIGPSPKWHHVSKLLIGQIVLSIVPDWGLVKKRFSEGKKICSESNVDCHKSMGLSGCSNLKSV